MHGPHSRVHRDLGPTAAVYIVARHVARSSGQGPRSLRSWRSPADGGHRSYFGLRLRARIRHSRQGPRAHPALGVLVRQDRRHRVESPRAPPTSTSSLVCRRRIATRCAAARCWCARRHRSQSNVWRAATSRVRAGRTTWPPARSAVWRCQPAFANRIACRNRSSRLRRKPTPATTRTSRKQRPRRWSATRCWRASRRSRWNSMPPASPTRRRAASSSPRKFEFGVTDSGELLLIDEVLTPDSSRYWPQDQVRSGRRATELRQAVRARLPGIDQVEQTAARAVAA